MIRQQINKAEARYINDIHCPGLKMLFIHVRKILHISMITVTHVLPYSIVRGDSLREPVNFVKLVYEICAQKKNLMKRVEPLHVDRATATKI